MSVIKATRETVWSSKLTTALLMLACSGTVICLIAVIFMCGLLLVPVSIAPDRSSYQVQGRLQKRLAMLKSMSIIVMTMVMTMVI